MLSIVLYLSGDRGLKILDALMCQNKYKIFVFSLVPITKLTELANNNIKYKNIEDLNSKKHITDIINIKPDIAIVAGFSKIFNKTLINIPRLGTINLHAGPLPKYRGGSPLNWQIINNEKQIGLSIISMDEGIDTGNLLSKSFFKLDITDDIDKVHKKANNLFSEMVIKVLNNIQNNSLKVIKKMSHKAIYWHQRSDLDGRIIWHNMTALQVYNFIRALTSPYKGAYTFFNDKKLRIYSAEIINNSFCGSPGRVVKIKSNELVVICSDRGLHIKNYKFEKFSGKLINGMHLS